MNIDKLKVLSSKTISASRFQITEDELEIDNKPAKYSFINIKPGICVIVKTPKGFAVLKEYRYPIKQFSYEFAAGIIDDGETPKDAAIREVKEETGFVADKIESLGEFYPSFGATDELIYLFYAECSAQLETEQEYTEFIECEFMTEDEVDALIISDKFKHGAGLVAWLKYKLNKCCKKTAPTV